MNINISEIPENYMKRYLGYKFFKDDSSEKIKVIRISNVISNKEIYAIDEDTNEVEKIELEELVTYTPLEPYGLLSINIITIGDNRDIVMMLYKLIEVKIGYQSPFCICRQSINDVFADLLCNDPEKENNLVGISCTRENCPANIEFEQFCICDSVDLTNIVAVYRTDTFNTIKKCIPDLDTFNKTLLTLYNIYLKSNKSKEEIDYLYKDKPCVDGWCKDLDTLVEVNNFMADFDYMCDITKVDFVLEDYLETTDTGVKALSYPALLFFDEVFKVNAVDTRVIEYNYNINLGNFNNTNYKFLRDKTDRVYLVVYLVSGEFLEKELEEKASKLTISDKLRLDYYNKYSNFTK